MSHEIVPGMSRVIVHSYVMAAHVEKIPAADYASGREILRLFGVKASIGQR